MPPPTKSDLKRSSAASAAFHSHYASLYGERWHTLHEALLAPTRHAALINSFAEEQPEGEKLDLGCVVQQSLTPPKKSKAGYLTHYNLDAASLLAPRALDPQPGDVILDMCAAPGGKTIALAQHATVHANEFDHARNKRLAANLQAYLPPNRYKVLKVDGTKAVFQQYDKVLVDAPCSGERHVIHKKTDWKLSKTLPKTQLALLLNALNAVKPGGRVVYATCSLSELENDGVIEKCLEKSKAEVVEIPDDDMSERTKYGRIALPDHPSGGGWGPIYFALLQKGS